ncbi:hypothetical protein, partial [Plasmodium yoelii yoelii]
FRTRFRIGFRFFNTSIFLKFLIFFKKITIIIQIFLAICICFIKFRYNITIHIQQILSIIYFRIIRITFLYVIFIKILYTVVINSFIKA